MMNYQLSAAKARWLFIDAFIPIGLVVFIWFPIGVWALADKGFVFERIIGGGDLVAISFAFLMAFQTEQILQSTKSKKNETAPNVINGLTVLFAMFAAVTYGVIKILHTQYDFPANTSEEVSHIILSMACFSISFCIFIIAYIYTAKSILEKQ